MQLDFDVVPFFENSLELNLARDSPSIEQARI